MFASTSHIEATFSGSPIDSQIHSAAFQALSQVMLLSNITPRRNELALCGLILVPLGFHRVHSARERAYLRKALTTDLWRLELLVFSIRSFE
jgi:hypothetical protein